MVNVQTDGHGGIVAKPLGHTQDTKRLEPFFFPGGEPGVLLIHGYLTAPDEMRPLGEALAQAGMTVLGIRLRGHGTRPEDLAGVRWQDWIEDARVGLAQLRRHCSQVSVTGLSLGAALALYVAAQEPVERLVVFSAPDRKLAHLMPQSLLKLAARTLHTLPKIGSDIRDPQARREHFTYQQIPLKNVSQLPALLQQVDAALPDIKAPTLLVQARHDRVVPPRTALRIAARLGGPHRILWLERGGHTVVLDQSREIAWQAARDWLLVKPQ